MKSVLLFDNEERLQHFLKSYSLGGQKGLKFMTFRPLGHEASRLLMARGFQKVTTGEVQRPPREKIITEYLRLMDVLSHQNGSKLWWATHIASRNRYSCQLQENIQKFADMVAFIKKGDFSCLVITQAPLGIIRSLRKVTSDPGIDIKTFGYGLQFWTRQCLRKIKKVLSVFYYPLRICYRKIYAKRHLGRKISQLVGLKQSYYVIKTFIYKHSVSENGEYHDIFFGNLPPFVKKSKNTLIFGDILKDYRECILKIKACKDENIVPMEYFVRFKDLIFGICEIIQFYARIPRNVSYFGLEIYDIIKDEIEQSFRGLAVYQAYYYWMVKGLLKNIDIETYLTTFENNPWEKMSILALRQFSPQTQVIAYQHTVIPQSFLPLFITESERSVQTIPERILTVGEKSKKIMERFGNYPTIKPVASCGLRYEYLYKTYSLSRRPLKTILVALDGLPEVHTLIDYLFAELKTEFSYKVILRLHPDPSISWDYLRKRFGYRLDAYPHFRVSEEPNLAMDLEAADCVMYWGSSVAFEAICRGKPAIHFDKGTSLSDDPLFECSDFKWVVEETDPLVNVLREIDSLSDQEFYARQKRAKRYIEEYFYPVTSQHLQAFLV